MIDNYDDKSFKICNVVGGLDVTRTVSSQTQRVFREAIKDVELIREYVSLATTNKGILGGFSDLKALNESLQWRKRGFTQKTTTVQAGIGYSDDRQGRDIDRFVSISNENPYTGDKETDLRIADTLSNILPWIVDRRSIERRWWTPHQNGRCEGPDKEPFMFDSLYTAAWFGTYSNVWMYYPPMAVFGNHHPLTGGDIIGGCFKSHELPFVQPNLPEFNPDRKAFLRNPYPDVARPGLSLITALAPVYYNRTFGNYTYNDVYIASTGVDIAVDSTSTMLDILLDKMASSSFAIIVDMEFHAIVISQIVVNRLYPKMTDCEDYRVVRNRVDGSIIEDRRNQTYLVSDTIHQPLTTLESADWKDLQYQVKRLRPGSRTVMTVNLTLTGFTNPREYYVMCERWDEVADWASLAFVSKVEVDKAISIVIQDGNSNLNSSLAVLSGERGTNLFGKAVISNDGFLDVLVSYKASPSWLTVDLHQNMLWKLKSGKSLKFNFTVNTTNLDFGATKSYLVFSIKDDDYPNCFYDHELNFPVSVNVLPKDCAALTGDTMRVPDSQGDCICIQSSIELSGICFSFFTLLFSTLLFLLFLLFSATYLYVRKQRERADWVWRINNSDLVIEENPIILGRGSFGLVIRAEYRGTPVAVKRAIPPKSNQQRSLLPLSHDDVHNRFLNDNEYSCSSKLGSTLVNGRHLESSQNSFRKISTNIQTAILNSQGEFLSTHTLCIGLNTIFHSNFSNASQRYRNSRHQRDLRNEFIREIRLLSKLRHPCITTVMGAVINSGEEPLLVMELMDHGSLFDLLQNETVYIDGEIVSQILQDIAQGLRFLHAATPQVIHGDLKTLNVLVDSRFRAKVADFGLSQKRGAGAVGTPYWMAPELLVDSNASITAASDVYSFGIVLYEVYSRRIPYEDEDFTETIRKICDPKINKRPDIPESMPRSIVELMQWCTHGVSHLRPTFRDIDQILASLKVRNVEPNQIFQYTSKRKKYWNSSTPCAADNLLLEIFPANIAESLRKRKKVEPQQFDCVTIFFSDIIDFPQIIRDLHPLKVIDLLDRLYTKMDSLSRTHGVFKVETVGDQWMGVTNLAVNQVDHAKRMAVFARNAIYAAKTTLLDEEDPSLGCIGIRIGMHSGPVIANVVGSRNCRYTLIGDTVNTASRMSTNSFPNRILCSQATANILQEEIPIDEWKDWMEYYGRIDVKGKGSMDTWIIPCDDCKF
jgi:serine/threonine protein kinase